MLGLEEDISPINQSKGNLLDTSVQMMPVKSSNRKQTLQDRRNERKGKININVRIEEDEEGY